MINRYSYILISAFLLCSCTTPTAPNQRFLWPPPPDAPRIEWIDTYSSQLDLPKSSFRSFRETIIGEDSPVTLKRPVEAKTDQKNDKIYVADMDRNTVFVFDFKELELRSLPVSSKNTGFAFIKPVSITLDNKQNIYVLDAYSKSILVYNDQEIFQHVIKINTITETPVSIQFSRFNNYILIADAKANRIIAIDNKGQKKMSIGKSGEDMGSFNRPTAMAINSKGDIIVADSFNARIQIFDNNGNFLRMFGSRGDGNAEFQLIKGVAVDPDDNIYVTDTRSNNIKIFNSQGSPLFVFGGYYAVSTTGKIAAGGFALPLGIDIDSNGTIVIADQLNARIQRFRYLKDSSNNVK